MPTAGTPITGTWSGEYTYGATYTTAGQSVPFTLSLTESSGIGSLLGKHRVLGYVRDDATRGGMPERGTIHGQRRGSRVRFRKTMPNHYVQDERGRLVDLREFARAEHGVELPDGLPPHHIDYEGTLGDDGETMQGTWSIRGGEGGTGTWTARRRSPLPNEV
jgi:hypothetical protein